MERPVNVCRPTTLAPHKTNAIASHDLFGHKPAEGFRKKAPFRKSGLPGLALSVLNGPRHGGKSGAKPKSPAGTMFPFFPVILLVVLSFAGSSSLCLASTIELRLAHSRPLAHSVNIGALAFKHRVETATSKTIGVEVIPEGRMGEDRSLLEQVLAGNLEMAALPLRYTLQIVPQSSLPGMPFFFTDRRRTFRILDGEFRKALFDLFDPKGLAALAWVYYGVPAIVNGEKPLERPQDFRGLRVNGPEDPLFYDTMTALEAIPSALGKERLAQALKSREVTAAQISLDQVLSPELKTVNRFITVPFRGIDLGILVINGRVWSELAPKFKAILLKAAEDFEDVNRGYQVQQEVYALAGAQSRGLSVLWLDQEDLKAFKTRMAPLYENWRQWIGAEWFNTLSRGVAESDIY